MLTSKAWKLGIDESMFLTETNVTVFGMKVLDDLTTYDTQWKHITTISDIEPSTSIKQVDSLLVDSVSSQVMGMLLRDIHTHQLHHYKVSDCGISWSYQGILSSNEFMSSSIRTLTEWRFDDQ